MTKLMTWVRRHKRTKMLIYYQDFGSTSAYRIQNYPASLAALSEALHHPVFPAFAPNPPVAPPPPPAASPRRPNRTRTASNSLSTGMRI
jgi:hypothetical protein